MTQIKTHEENDMTIAAEIFRRGNGYPSWVEHVDAMVVSDNKDERRQQFIDYFFSSAGQYQDEQLLAGVTLSIQYVLKNDVSVHDPEFGEIQASEIIFHTDGSLRSLVDEGLTVDDALSQLIEYAIANN